MGQCARYAVHPCNSRNSPPNASPFRIYSHSVISLTLSANSSEQQQGAADWTGQLFDSIATPRTVKNNSDSITDHVSRRKWSEGESSEVWALYVAFVTSSYESSGNSKSQTESLIMITTDESSSSSILTSSRSGCVFRGTRFLFINPKTTVGPT